MANIRFILEPVLVLYFTGVFLQIPVLQQYAYSWFSEKYGLSYTYDSHVTSCDGDVSNTTFSDLQKKVQAKSAEFFSGVTICQLTPTIFTMLFYGPISDRRGRKPVILLTCAMTTICSCIITTVFVLKLNIAYIFIGLALDGIGGSYPTMLILAASYISDITLKEKLPFRLAICEACSLAALSTVYLFSGMILSKLSFTITEMIVAGVSLSAFFWLLFIVKESLISTSIEIQFKQILKSPYKSWKVLTRARRNKWKTYLCIICLLFNGPLGIGIFNVISLFLINTPLCFTAVDIGYYIGSLLFIIAIGTLLSISIGLKIVSKPALAFFSLTSALGYFMWLSCTHSKSMLYGGLALKAFSQAYAPIFRTLLSHSVEPCNIGTIFAMEGSISQAAQLTLNIAFNTLYAAFNTAGKPSRFFLIPAGLCIIPIISCISYWCNTKQESEETEALLQKSLNDTTS